MSNGKTHHSSGGQKREPIAHAINPKAVEQIGVSQYQSKENLHAGRGFTAPQPVATTQHHCGSQGKHK